MEALGSMSPHVALEAQGVSKVLATDGTGEKPRLVVPLGEDTVSFLTVLVGGWMEQFSMP